MEEKLLLLIKDLCTGLVTPCYEFINIFDFRRAIRLSHYVYETQMNLNEQCFIDALKLNDNFRLNDEECASFAQNLISKITEIREIYRVTAELENLHI